MGFIFLLHHIAPIVVVALVLIDQHPYFPFQHFILHGNFKPHFVSVAVGVFKLECDDVELFLLHRLHIHAAEIKSFTIIHLYAKLVELAIKGLKLLLCFFKLIRCKHQGFPAIHLFVIG